MNYSNYENEEVDRLIEDGWRLWTTGDAAARSTRRCRRSLMDEAPWGFIAYPEYTLARKADLKGFTYYTSNNLRFQDFCAADLSVSAREGRARDGAGSHVRPGSSMDASAHLRSAFAHAAARPRFALGYAIVRSCRSLALACAAGSRPIRRWRPTRHASSSRRAGAICSAPTPSAWTSSAASIYAPRIDLTIAMLGTLLSALVGGTASARSSASTAGSGLRVGCRYAIMRAADVLQAFPVFVFAIALVAVLGQSVQTVVIAIAFVNAPIYLRLMRAQVLGIRGMRYVEAAQVAGLSDLRTIVRHVVPNAMAPVLAQLSVNIGWSDPADRRRSASSAPACARPRPNGAA